MNTTLKRFMSMMLVLMMVFSVIPANADTMTTGTGTVVVDETSTDEATETGVAEVGGVLYNKLTEAFEAAKDGETIYLQKNVDEVVRLSVSDADSVRSIVLDLKGYTWDCGYGTRINAVDLKIRNGIIGTERSKVASGESIDVFYFGGHATLPSTMSLTGVTFNAELRVNNMAPSDEELGLLYSTAKSTGKAPNATTVIISDGQFDVVTVQKAAYLTINGGWFSGIHAEDGAFVTDNRNKGEESDESEETTEITKVKEVYIKTLEGHEYTRTESGVTITFVDYASVDERNFMQFTVGASSTTFTVQVQTDDGWEYVDPVSGTSTVKHIFTEPATVTYRIDWDKNGTYDRLVVLVKSPVAKVGDELYTSLQEAVDAAQESGGVALLADIDGTQDGVIDLIEDVALTEAVKVSANITLNLNGKTISSTGDVFEVVEGGTLTINGDGEVKGGTSGVGSWTAVWANGGNVIINGGTYSVGGDSDATDTTHQNDVIYTKDGGTVTITGGTFLNDGTVWTLNQNDSTGGDIIVTGGTFHNWNPANNVSEGAETSFVKLGYVSRTADEGKTFTVTEWDNEIWSAEELLMFAEMVNAGNGFAGETVTLKADIDLTGTYWFNVDAEGNVLADYRINNFAGNFDGNNKTISNLSLLQEKVDGGYGLCMFRTINGGTVKNLTLDGITAEAKGNASFYVINSIMTSNSAKPAEANLVNVHLKNATVNIDNAASTEGYAQVAGMVRWVGKGTWAQNCSVTNLNATVTGVAAAGGFGVFIAQTSEMYNCDVTNFTLNVGSVTYGVGGFAGQVQSSSYVQRVFNDCDVSGLDITVGYLDAMVGGFLGNLGGMVNCDECDVAGKITIKSDAENAHVGGFIGDLGWQGDWSSDKIGHTFDNCSAAVDITAVNSDVGGFVGMSAIVDDTALDQDEAFAAVFNNCSASGNVYTLNGAAGGFVGSGDRGEYHSCTASGSVSGAIAGGFWGELFSMPAAPANGNTGKGDAFTGVVVEGCTASTSVNGAEYEAGLIGYMDAQDENTGYATPLTLNSNSNAEINDINAVAQIGETKYVTLDAAIEAAQTDDTIILLTDLSAAEINVTDVTIDLNGKTLTLTAGDTNFYGESTVKNGTINITGCVAKGDCIIGVGDYSNTATLDLNNVKITGDGYSSAYAVLYVYGSSILNINGGSVVVSNDNAAAGGVIKAESDANGKINITAATLSFTNAKIGILDGTVSMEDVHLDITGGANAINGSALTVKNSNLTIKDCDGRALTLNQGDVNIENSTLDFSGATEGEIRFKAGLTLNIAGDTDIAECDIWTDVEGAKVVDADGTEFVVTGTEAAPNTITVVDGELILVVSVTDADGTVTYYDTLAEAVAAANAIKGGATVELLKDVTLGEKLTITGDVTIEGAYTITRDDAYTDTLFAVNAGAALTLDGGLTIDGGNNYTFDSATYAADLAAMNQIASADAAKYFAPEEGAPVATACMITTGGTVNLNDVTIQNNYSTGSGIVSASKGAKVTLTGAQITHNASTNGSGLVVNASAGVYDENGNNAIIVTMNEGTVIDGNHVGGNHGVFKIYCGTHFIMNGGEIKNTTGWNSNGVAVGVYWAAFTMNGGTICSNSSVYGSSNGRNAAVYLHSASQFVMNGGTICHNSGRARGGIDAPYTGSEGNAASAVINGGNVVDNISIGGNTNQDVYGGERLTITGGTYTQDVSQWLAPNYALTEVDGTYTVTHDIAEVNGQAYGSVAEAVAAAAAGDTVTVLASHKMQGIVAIDKDITLDLNGMTITCVADDSGYSDGFRVLANVTVTGNGTIDADESGYAFFVGDDTTAGNLTIKNGSFYGSTTAAQVTKGELTIEDGYFQATEYNGAHEFTLNCKDAYYKAGEAKITVMGGTFYKFDPMNNAAEGEGTNFVPEGYISETKNDGETYTVRKANYIAEVVETGVKYESLHEAINACTNGETVKLIADVVYEAGDAVYAHGGTTGFGPFDKYHPSIVYTPGTRVDGVNSPSNVNAVFDLNGYSITNNADAYMFLLMDNAKLTFTGEGSITNRKAWPVIWVTGVETYVTINGGTYSTANDEGLLWSTHGGDLVINGGSFGTTAEDTTLLIMRNEKDLNQPDYFVDGNATITIYGGVFEYNPEVTYDDSTTDPFLEFNAVAEGYKAVDNGDGTWTVKPLITVTIDDVVMVLGNEMPEFTYTVAPEDAEVTVTDITVATEITEVGEYELTAEATPADAAYAVEVIPGTLTVKEANVEMDDIYYNTIKDALDTLKSADTTTHTVKVLKDHDIDVNYSTYNYPILVNGFSVILDMNGKTITADWSAYTGSRTDNALIGLYNGGKLTVIGNGTIKNLSDGKDGVQNRIFWVGNSTATKSAVLTIENGTFIQEDNIHLLYAMSDKNNEVYTYIKGGYFDTSFDDFFNAYDYNKQYTELTGGTYTVDPTDWELVIPADYWVVDNENGTWSVVLKKVASIGDTTYSSVQAAVDAAQAGDTITLLVDVAITESINVAADDEITLDLNGHALTNSIPEDASVFHTITNNGSLTVIDSVGGGKLVSNSAKGYVIYTEGGSLVVDGAKIVGINQGYAVVTWTAGDSVTIEEGTVIEGRGALYIDGGATGTVNGGIFTMTVQTTNNQDNVVYVGGASELTINGGTFTTGEITGAQRIAIAALGTSKVTINNGTFYGLTGDIQTKNSASVVVAGGIFTGTKMDERTADSIALKGGTYSYDPTEWVAEGYKAVDNEDGTWTVREFIPVAENTTTSEQYETIQLAVDAAAAGDTITVIADVTDETVTVDKSVTITGEKTLTDVTITGSNSCELTVSGLTFKGNSWINAGTASKLTVSGVTATEVAPVNGSGTANNVTNARSAFISLGASEQQELALVVENSTIYCTGNYDAIIGWAKITSATISGNTFGSESAYNNNNNVVKLMGVAEDAVITFKGNTVYANWNGLVVAPNTTRGNAHTIIVEGNTFVGDADFVWIETQGATDTYATVKATSTDNTVNDNAFTAADIKTDETTWYFYGGVDVETNEEGKLIGGTFNEPSNKELVAEGYKAVDNEDGTWTVVEKKPAADLLYAGYIEVTEQDNEERYRASMKVDLYEVYAEESLVVELWRGDTKMSTTTLRATDRDDESAALYPADTDAITANIVIEGRLAGSWDTEWHVEPSADIIPDTIKVYADGELTDTWNEGFINETEEAEYIAIFDDGLFDIYAANVRAGDSLDMFFYVQKSDLDGEEYYAEIVRTFSDGSADDVVQIPYSSWVSFNADLFRFNYDGIAAKEMTDEVYVTIYNSDGTAASNLWTDSVSLYAIRALENATDKLRTALVDMLNYGAAAQQFFDYNTSDLANAEIGDYQQYATPSVSYADYRVKGDNYAGSTVSAENKLVLTFYFRDITPDMTATITYTDHYGSEKVLTPTIFKSGTLYGAPTTGLAIADGRQLVTCEITDADGNVVASATDSVESYVARQASVDPVFELLMKFVESAYNYFH